MCNLLLSSETGIIVMGVLVYAVLIAVFLLAIREIACWYYKINKRVDSLERIADSVADISNQLENVLKFLEKKEEEKPVETGYKIPEGYQEM